MNSHLDKVRQKIWNLDQLNSNLEHWKLAKEKIVFTNGCFDILHLGHLSYLMQAADLGTKLIIGLNSDQSVRNQEKSPERPILDQNSRAIALASLSYIDAVVVFETDTPLELIRKVEPDILVKGADYNPASDDPNDKAYIVGSKEVKELDGEIRVVPLLEGYSTTSIVNRIKA